MDLRVPSEFLKKSCKWFCKYLQVKICKGLMTLGKFSLASQELQRVTYKCSQSQMFKKLAPALPGTARQRFNLLTLVVLCENASQNFKVCSALCIGYFPTLSLPLCTPQLFHRCQMYAGPHPHETQREKRSKSGCANPVVTTVLYTLYAKQQVMQCHAHKWNLAPFIRIASCVASGVDAALGERMQLTFSCNLSGLSFVN